MKRLALMMRRNYLPDPGAAACAIALFQAIVTASTGCGGTTGSTQPREDDCSAGKATCDASADATRDGPYQDSATDAGFDDSQVGDSATESPDALAPGECPTGPGPTMVALLGPDASTICIDTTEVTNAQYAIFLASDAGTSGQPSTCAGNTTYQPATTQSCPAGVDDPNVRSNYPVVCIDWCDAFAYCVWAGKRLCADVNNQPIDVTDASSVPASYFACSNGNVTGYEYGQTYVAHLCNDSYYDPGHPGPIPVASDSQCHGIAPPYSSVFDLTGNVAEYQDNGCNNGGCLVHGSSYVDGEPGCLELSPLQTPTLFYALNVGFRCCDIH